MGALTEVALVTAPLVIIAVEQSFMLWTSNLNRDSERSFAKVLPSK